MNMMRIDVDAYLESADNLRREGIVIKKALANAESVEQFQTVIEDSCTHACHKKDFCSQVVEAENLDDDERTMILRRLEQR